MTLPAPDRPLNACELSGQSTSTTSEVTNKFTRQLAIGQWSGFFEAGLSRSSDGGQQQFQSKGSGALWLFLEFPLCPPAYEPDCKVWDEITSAPWHIHQPPRPRMHSGRRTARTPVGNRRRIEIEKSSSRRRFLR
jgi:hypothetical protein